MKKKNFRKLLAFALTLCMLFSILPSSYPVSAATTATTYDFNGVDFNTTLKTNNLGNGASLTTSAPDGYTGSVIVGSGSTYVAVGVNFPLAIDTSKIASVKVRMYVASYSISGSSTPQLRVISDTESTGDAPYSSNAFISELGGAFDQWVELDITDGVKNKAAKDSDGFLDRFVVAYRAYGASDATVYFDSITFSYEGDMFVAAGPMSVDVYDFNGTDFSTPTKTNNYVNNNAYFAKSVNDTSAVPTGYTDGVYAVSSGTYCATWVNFFGKLDLNKITSIRARIYIGSYTLESSSSQPSFRVFGTSNTYVQQSHDGTYDQWFELELLDILKNSAVTKNSDGSIGTFLLSYRTYGAVPTTIYFDSIIIEGTDYYTPIQNFNTSIDRVNENDSGQAEPGWFIYFSHTASGSLPGSAWETHWTNIKATINNAEKTLLFKNGGGNHLFLEIGYADLAKDTSFAKVVIKAGTYSSNDGTASLALESDFTFYVYDGDVWNNASSVDYTVDITFERIDTAVSQVNGDKWDMYPVPVNPAQTPGVDWQSTWANVIYIIDGVSYTGQLMRAHNNQGLYLKIPNTQLSPAADGTIITIKAGTYKANSSDDPNIRVTEDFTFYVIKGTPVTEFDFDAPEFTSTVYNSVTQSDYIITDADTVTINGEIYNRGDIFNKIGTHSLSYNAYNRQYTRTVVIWRAGEVCDNETIDICDIVRIKRYLAGQATLTESGMLGADLNNDSAITSDDVSMLRRMQVLLEGFLVLSPQNGVEALLPSEQVAALETAYDLTASASHTLKNGTNLYHRKALTLKWVPAVDMPEYNVHVATNADFSDEFIHKTNRTQYTLLNLLPATTYYWKVSAGNIESEVFRFVTADTVRTLTIDGVSNSRDIGGYAALNGTTMKYGMVYRTASLDAITEEGKYQMRTVLGVKTDLDVRTPGEGTAGTGSPLGNDINYLNFDAPYYWPKLISNDYREALLGEIRAFANADNYPIVVHCSVGRDRTGTILFLIQGLCGMSKSDIYFDYEMSFLSEIGGGVNTNVPSMMSNLDVMYDNIQAYAPNGTFAEACEAFVLSLGITQSEIDSIRANLTA